MSWRRLSLVLRMRPSAPGDPLTYQHDVLSRRERTDVQSTPAAARDYTYVTAGTELVRVDNTPNTAETLDLLWDSQGRVRRRIMSGPPATVTEDLSYGYHDRLLQLVVDDQGRTGGCPASEQTDSSNHSDHETWAYRYGPGGLREQKRLVTDQLDDRTLCGVAPWTHYVRSPGGDPLVVYHGRQTSENPCSVTGLGLCDRRVHIYAHEYRVYGPDGLRVLFERNAQGVFVKRAVTLDAQGSIAAVTDAAGYQHAEIHDDHGERTTVPQRRTGWLDRELDYETAPGHVRHKLYDLDHRKYDGAAAQFLSVDPLWPMFLSSGSYVYCTGDAVNKIDPWGLGEKWPINPHPGKTQLPGTGASPLHPGKDSPMIVGHEAEYYRVVEVWLYDIAIGRYLRRLGATGDGIGPHGSGPGQSWVAPPRGIGPGGKEGVWPGVPYSVEYATGAQRPWMIHATGELGVSEFDPGDNPRILEYHAAVKPNFDSDQTPWCASFVTWSLQRAGIMDFASASAAKWIGFGMRLSKPEYGAIAVYRRVTRNGEVQNHVAFIAGVNRKGSIVLLGGNQSDLVSLSTPRGGKLLYFGLPTGFIPTGYLPLIGGRVTSGGSTR